MFTPTPQMVAILVIVLVLWIAMMGAGVYVFVRALRKNTGGSWTALARRYEADALDGGEQVFPKETVQVGAVRAKWCTTVGVGARGLSLKAPWTKRLLIPWDEIRAARETTLFQRTAYALKVGTPPVATVTVFRPIYEAIHPHLHAPADSIAAPIAISAAKNHS